MKRREAIRMAIAGTIGAAVPVAAQANEVQLLDQVPYRGTFEWAMMKMREGLSVHRRSWNDGTTFLRWSLKNGEIHYSWFEDEVGVHDWTIKALVMQSDLVANDWEVAA